MGCDIHLHSEVKRKGVWQHHSEAKIKRNYAFFTKIAGVRNDFEGQIQTISAPRGLPIDATELTLLHSEKYGTAGHSHSWLSANEISMLHKWIRYDDQSKDYFGEHPFKWEHDNLPYFMGNLMSGFIDFPEDWETYGIEDVRYVFFFDN